MNMWTLMQRDKGGGERREAGKGGRGNMLHLGQKIEREAEVLGMLTSEVETAKTVPRQV